MELNPRQLDAFRKVMLTGSMTGAAERLRVSQPAVSRLIKDLEATLGMRLFRREGNRLIPGAEAQVLFREVDLFYRGIEQVERVAKDLKSLNIGRLRIASMSALALNILCECLNKYSATRPGVLVSLDVRNSLSVLELAAANQIDIGFIHQLSSDYPGVDIFPLQKVPAVCVMPAGHRLSERQVVRTTDLDGEAIISLGPNNPLRVKLEAYLNEAQISYSRPIETTLAYSACNFVKGKIGLTIVDPFTAAQFQHPEVVTRPLEPRIPFECSYVLPAHQPRPQVVQDFIHVVTEYFGAAARGKPMQDDSGRS